MMFIGFLAGNLLVSVAVTMLVARQVYKRSNPRDEFKWLQLMWLGYSGANLFGWMIGFYNSGYTAFGAVFYGCIAAGIFFVIPFSAMLLVVLLAGQNRMESQYTYDSPRQHSILWQS